MLLKKIFLLLILFNIYGCGEINNVSLNNSKHILALGDSLTIGYGLNIDDSYPYQLENILLSNNYNYKVINGGISGNTSENLLERLNKYDNINADIYLINIGANDGLRKLDTNKMKKNIEKIIDYLKIKNPNGKIILFGTKLPMLFGLSYSNDFNKKFIEISKNKKIFYYGDFLDGINGIPKYNSSDGLHPNKKGYTIIANNIYNYLKDNNFIINNN